jgi:hypothetical protein
LDPGPARTAHIVDRRPFDHPKDGKATESTRDSVGFRKDTDGLQSCSARFMLLTASLAGAGFFAVVSFLFPFGMNAAA